MTDNFVSRYIEKEWLAGPFGTPDASRADAKEDYLQIPGATPDLKDVAGRFRERIVIGKKGAGKTMYLRTLQQKLTNQGFNKIDNEFEQFNEWIVFSEIFQLQSQDVIDLSRTFKRAHAMLISKNISVDHKSRARELWTRVWECALTASIYKLIFSSTDKKVLTDCQKYVRQTSPLNEKYSYIEKFFSDLPPAISPVIMIKHFKSTHSDDIGSLRDYLSSPHWDILYELLSSIVNRVPQIAIFIDAIDDSFDQAPESWLECQEGLFRSIFRVLNRGDDFSNRVHVIVALREIALSSLLHSEHASRYLSDSHVRYISWDESTARSFLFEKISHFPKRSTPIKNEEVDVSRYPFDYWLGMSRVVNVERNVKEPISDYILRHTRLLPRDIVIMGNAISQASQRRVAEGREFSEAKLRQTVHEVSKSICLEAVFSSVNEFLSSMDYVAEILLSSEKSKNIFDEFRSAASGNRERSLEKRLNDHSIDEVVDLIRTSVEGQVSRFFFPSRSRNIHL